MLILKAVRNSRVQRGREQAPQAGAEWEAGPPGHEPEPIWGPGPSR